MQNDIQILSINCATERQIEIGNERVPTGIFKQPVATANVTKLGIAGDTVADQVHHGGVDQAVYLYSSADYRYWADRLQRDLPYGIFGENITLSNFGSATPRIGDRIQLGAVLLEVTSGRVPCSKLAARVGIPQFVKQFAQAERPGLYTRVLKTGTLQLGDSVTWLPTSADQPTVNELLATYYAREHNATTLERMLAAPIAERARALFQRWLAELAQ